MLNFIFIKSTNFGDAINQTFWEKIIDTNIEECDRNKNSFYNNRKHYVFNQ